MSTGATNEHVWDLECENSPPSGRLIVATEIRFSEIISALSVALDITQGQIKGHCMRNALIGMRLAQSLNLPTADRSALFYALLLKDLGCSSNAAKMAYLFRADDHEVKRSIRMINWTKPGECIKHCWTHCASGGSVFEKMLQMAVMMRKGAKAARQISEIRCDRGPRSPACCTCPRPRPSTILTNTGTAAATRWDCEAKRSRC